MQFYHQRPSGAERFLSARRNGAVLCVICALQAPATGAVRGSDTAQFAAGVNLVEVYVTVIDQAGDPVTSLTRADFTVYEDDDPQAITTFAAEDVPLSVALAIDRSWSMAGERLALARAAARAFLAALSPADCAMLLAIGSETEVLAPLSTDRAAQLEALQRFDSWGTTGLYDAIIAALDLIQPAQGRRALVLLSDGSDRYSRATAVEAIERARRADVLVYPIALGKARPPLFAELAVLTGGSSFHLRDPRALGETLTKIARELRHQYLLGYAPARPIVPGSGEWRSIRVVVDRPGVRVRARDGYLAQ